MKTILQKIQSTVSMFANAIRRATRTAFDSDFLLFASAVIAVGAVLVSPPPLWSIPLAFSAAGIIVYGANIMSSITLGSIWNVVQDVAEKFRRPVIMADGRADAGINAPSVARMGSR